MKTFFNTATTSQHQPETSEDYYRKIYFEVYDNLIVGIEKRFDQPDLKMTIKLQLVLTYATNKFDYENESQDVTIFYNELLNVHILKHSYISLLSQSVYLVLNLLMAI